MNIKSFFEDYHTTQLKQIDVDAAFEHRLKQQILSRTARPSRFDGVRRLFTISVMTTSLALIILTVVHQSSSSANPLNVAKTILQPQEALAASLKTTFGTEDVIHTFGLGNPDEFRYRRLQIFNERQIFTQGSSPTDATWTTRPYEQKIELWGFQGNMWQQIISQSDQDATFIASTSSLISTYDQVVCTQEYRQTQEHLLTRCPSIAAEQENRIESVFTFEEFSRTVTPDFFSHVSVEPFEDPYNGPSYAIRWATTAPMQKGWLAYRSAEGEASGRELFNYEKAPDHFYTNHYRDGLYWHSSVIDTNFHDVKQITYFQFTDVSHGSLFYEYNMKSAMLRSLTLEEFTAVLREVQLQQKFMEGLYYTLMEPVYYFMSHPELFEHPLDISTEDLNGTAVSRMRLALPGELLTQLTLPHSQEPGDLPTTAIDIWFDPLGKGVVQYEILNNGHSLSKVVIEEDRIVTETTPDQFFRLEKWKKENNIDEDHILYEPEKIIPIDRDLLPA